MAIIFLIYPTYSKQDRSKVALYDWLLFILALVTAGYLIFEYTAIVTTRGGIPNTMDIVMAIMTVLLVLEAARRVTGWILPIISTYFFNVSFH